MNVAMMTNTYLPHVGGVAQSVHRFSTSLRARGHQVLVVAPAYGGVPDQEDFVVRMPAMQNFNGSDFSVTLPVPGYLATAFSDFAPHIIHSHHPFLIGDLALRKAASGNLPIVFTHHTLYEQYVHYVPGEAEKLREFVKELSTGYANLCNHIVAPSESIKKILMERGVETPITVVPTGVDLGKFAKGDGAAFRRQHGIPSDAFVFGHVGRLAPEKNIEFLMQALAMVLKQKENVWCVVVGDGSSRDAMQRIAQEAGVAAKTIFTGKQTGQDLVDAYHCFDCFAFSSKSETQGMVLEEAMSAGNPVVGLEASGVCEVVRDKKNGRLVRQENLEAFSEALRWVAELDETGLRELVVGARATTTDFSVEACAARLERVYERTLDEHERTDAQGFGEWASLLGRIEKEWDLWTNRLNAARAALFEAEEEDAPTILKR